VKYVDPPLNYIRLAPSAKDYKRLPCIRKRQMSILHPSCRYSTLQSSPHASPCKDVELKETSKKLSEKSKIIFKLSPTKATTKDFNQKRISKTFIEMSEPPKETPSECLVYLQQNNKQPTKKELIEMIEVALLNADKNIEEYYKVEVKDTINKLKLAKKENVMIRYHLKTLSELLGQLLPFKNQELYRKQPKKPSTNKNPKVNQIISENYLQRLNYYETEYFNSLKRWNQVKDPEYKLALKNKCLDLDKEISKTKKKIEIYKNNDKITNYVLLLFTI